MARFVNVRLITAEGHGIYVNPFFVPAILPFDESNSVLKIKGARQQIVKGTPDEIYNAFNVELNGGAYDDPNT